jgi:hypothetical protein
LTIAAAPPGAAWPSTVALTGRPRARLTIAGGFHSAVLTNSGELYTFGDGASSLLMPRAPGRRA